MSEARPPITLRAGFSYSRKRFVAEVAVVQSEGAGGAAAACGPSLDGITVGWGEVDAADGAETGPGRGEGAVVQPSRYS